MPIVKGKKPGKKILVGYGNLHLVKFNPTGEELTEIYESDNPISEPQYMDDEGNLTLRVVGFVIHQGKKHFVNYRIGVINENVKTIESNGETLKVYITGKGYTTLGVDESAVKSRENIKWMGTDVLREARGGEDDFYKFMIAWMKYNQNSDEILDLTDIFNSLLKGDVSVLNNMIDDDSDQGLMGFTVPVMLTERNGYQDIYNVHPWANGTLKPVFRDLDYRESRGNYYHGRANWDTPRALVEFDASEHQTYADHKSSKNQSSTESTTDITGGF